MKGCRGDRDQLSGRFALGGRRVAVEYRFRFPQPALYEQLRADRR